MSRVDPEEVSVVVERDGVKTEKTFEPDDFPVPAIAFAIVSERDEPVDVRLVDQVPEDIPAEDIGFHPKYGAEYWSVEGETIVFEREFEPGEEYTTVYGLRAKDTDRVDRFLGEPTLERVEPELEDASQAVRDVIGEIDLDEESRAGATGTGTGTGTGTATGTGTGTGTAASSDDLETAVSSVEASTDVESAVSSFEPDTDTGGGGEAAEPAIVEVGDRGTSPEAVASTLAAELREGQVPDSDLRVLREALDVEARGSERARITRLQQDVHDLRAYTDALEAFLDEEGEAQTLLRELRSEIGALAERVKAGSAQADMAAERAGEAIERVDDIDDDVTEVSETANQLDDRVDHLAERADSVDDRVDELAQLSDRVDELAQLSDRVDELAELPDRVDELNEHVDSIDARVDDLAHLPDRVDSIEAEFDEVDGDITRVEASVRDLRSEADSTADTVQSIDERVETIEAGLGDVGAVDDRLAEIEEDLEGLRSVEDRMEELDRRLEEAHSDLQELAQMRDQLSSVFGSSQSAGGEGS